MNNNKYYLLSFCIIGLLLLSQACNSPKKETIVSTGWWTGSIEMQGNTLNFGFEIQKNENTYAIRLKNGLEYLQLDDVVLQKDSIHFTFHIFDAIVNAKINENNMIGFYTKNYIEGYVL